MDTIAREVANTWRESLCNNWFEGRGVGQRMTKQEEEE